ncbi:MULTISPECIES: FAD-dependent oxidoreductase [Streptomyces]|uniref:FAD-dependent oxidoreductase n=1 Tax=Streptomyces sp. NBC_00093 TaxID=2975649 RepID=A0AAU2ADZ4_9ACTN
MAHTVVIGAGPVGLVTAMLLAADGHQVTVLDRDSMDPRDRKRPGVRQFAQPHGLLPGGLRLLERELPTGVAELVAVGGRPYDIVGGAWGVDGVGPR